MAPGGYEVRVVALNSCAKGCFSVMQKEPGHQMGVVIQGSGRKGACLENFEKGQATYSLSFSHYSLLVPSYSKSSIPATERHACPFKKWIKFPVSSLRWV